jgi:hypothetical protein
MSFFCLTEGQADGGPLQLSLARALTASYGACSPYPRYFMHLLLVLERRYSPGLYGKTVGLTIGSLRGSLLQLVEVLDRNRARRTSYLSQGNRGLNLSGAKKFNKDDEGGEQTTPVDLVLQIRISLILTTKTMMPGTAYSSSQSQQEQESKQQHKMHEIPPTHLPSPPQRPREEWTSEMALGERSAFDDTLYRHGNGNDHEFVFGNDPTSHWHQQQQTRSSPIAIIRNSTDRSSQPEIGHGLDQTDDDEDDDSSVDVELDALKLKAKYGGDVVAASRHEPLAAKSLLKAPYLGAMSQSAPYLSHEIPQISLAEQHHFDPRTELLDSGTGVGEYGSLRESHQRGRFLDGPASYRDGRSGEIRPLNHGKRFSHSSVPASISIGERIQKARLQKEQLQKQQQQGGNGGVNGAMNKQGAATAASSLSAMMDGVSKTDAKVESSDASAGLGGTLLQGSKPPGVMMTAMVSSHDHRRDMVSDFQDDEEEEEDDGQGMMSTSLTGLELLRSSKLLVRAGGGDGQRGVGFFMGHSAQYSHASLMAPKSLVVNEPLSAVNGGVGVGGGDSDHQFQALSRTMSDPTPHLRQGSTITSPSVRQIQHVQPQPRPLLLPPQSSMTTSTPPSFGWSPFAYGPGGGTASTMTHMGSGHPDSIGFGLAASPAGSDHYVMPGTSPLTATTAVSTTTSFSLDHNPDTDGAFDMDME